MGDWLSAHENDRILRTFPVSKSLIMAFQVSTRDVSVSKTASCLLAVFGKRSFPAGKATGQWITATISPSNVFVSTQHTVKIKILQAELLERLVERRPNLVRPMCIVPKLGCDKEIFAFDDGRNDFLQSPSDPFLILINSGEVKMAVASSDGNFDLLSPRTATKALVERQTTVSLIKDIQRSRPHLVPTTTSQSQSEAYSAHC